MKKSVILCIFMIISLIIFCGNVNAATSTKAGNRAPTISTSSGKTEVTITVKDTDGIKSINVYKYSSSTKKWNKINNLKTSGSSTSKKFTLKEGTYQIVAKDSCKTSLATKSKIVIKKSSTKMSTNSSPKITILNKPYGASYAYQGAGKNKNVIYAIVSDGNGIKGLTVTDQNKKKVNATIKKLASGKESLYSIVLPNTNQGVTKYRIKAIDNSKNSNYRIEQVMIATKKYTKKTVSSSSSGTVSASNAVTSAPNTSTITNSNTSTTQNKTMYILFVGNSKTFYHQPYRILAHLAKTKGITIKYKVVKKGGATLQTLYNLNGFSSAATAYKYDYLILQEQTGRAQKKNLDSRFKTYAKNIIDKVKTKSPDVKIIFNAIWIRSDTNSKYQTYIDNNNNKVAQELGGTVCYSGSALRSVMKKYDVYSTDKNHATPTGAYLEACCLYATIFKTSPKGIAYYKGYDTKSKNKGYVTIKTAIAKELQKVAWQYNK